MGLPMESVLVITAEHPSAQSLDREQPSTTAPAAYALALANAVRAAGGRAAIVTPAVGNSASAMAMPAARFSVGAEPRGCKVSLRRAGSGPTIYEVSIDTAFPREGTYGPRPGIAYTDNALRFALFSQAVLEVARRLSPAPEHLFLCDWPCAPAAAFASNSRLPFKPVVLVFDPRYQGLVDAAEFRTLGLPQEFFHRDTGEFFGKFSLLKAGSSHATKVCGLSGRHAQKLCSAAAGLEGFFKQRRHALAGLPASLSIVAAGGPARRSPEGCLHIYPQAAAPPQIAEFLAAVDMLCEMGISQVYHRPDQENAGYAEQVAIETAIRKHEGVFRRATQNEGCGAIALFLDAESADPLPALRAWLAGAIVCAPATPCLQDTRCWLEKNGFDVDAFLLFRNKERLGLFDIVQEATRRRGNQPPKATEVLDAAMRSAAEELRLI